MESRQDEGRCQGQPNYEELLRENVNNAGINTGRSTMESTADLPGAGSDSRKNDNNLDDNVTADTDNQNAGEEIIIQTAVEHLCVNSSNQIESDTAVIGMNAVNTSRSRCIPIIGAILRIMGDEQYCRACGMHLRVMGDEINFMYAARRLISPLLQELAMDGTETAYY